MILKLNSRNMIQPLQDCTNLIPQRIKSTQIAKKNPLFDSENDEQNQKMGGKFKTEICKNWAEKGTCQYGNKCRFAHGSWELVPKGQLDVRYKSKDCVSFFSTCYCPYGKRCMFKHDERSTKEISNIYNSILVNFPEMKENNKSKRLPVFTQMSNKDEYNLHQFEKNQEKLMKSIFKEDDMMFDEYIKKYDQIYQGILLNPTKS